MNHKAAGSYRLGLIADTHAPERLLSLPDALAIAFAGVDLILHAGDVGELWVLDQLSQFAPVIAVHGNDDSEAATTSLPYSQVLSIQGRRILLWHSHFLSWPDEADSRKGDDLLPKLDRIIAHAEEAGCAWVVFGHWHIPLVFQSRGVTAINPGALASGNEITRQLRQTCAILTLEQTGEHQVMHRDLARPHAPFDPQFDAAGGFLKAAQPYSRTILAEDAVVPVASLRATLPRRALLQLRHSILPLAHRCWQGQQDAITYAQLLRAIEDDTRLSESLKRRALEILRAAGT